MNAEKVKNKRYGRKRRARIPKKFLFFLLSLGIAGVCIGITLFGVAFLQKNSRLMTMGLIYIAIFTAILFVRAAIVQFDNVRKRRYATGE